jgi:hypothetical protein
MKISRRSLPASPVELLNFLVQENEVTTRELGALLGIDHFRFAATTWTS